MSGFEFHTVNNVAPKNGWDLIKNDKESLIDGIWCYFNLSP